MNNIHKELFIKALDTLFNSWGSDTPSEVYWSANELLDYFEAVNDVKLNVRFEEPYNVPPNYDNENNYSEVIEKIKNL